MGESTLVAHTPQRQVFRLRSLRVRIILFAALVCLILLVLIGGVIGALRNTQSASLRTAERHLHMVALSVQQAYNANENVPAALAQLSEPTPHPPAKLGPEPNALPHTCGAASATSAPPPRTPARHLSNSCRTRSLQSRVLKVGSSACRAGRLVGMPSPLTKLPALRKRCLCGNVRQSRNSPVLPATSGAEKSLRFQGRHDAVLFDAIPLRASGARGAPVIGAAWLMQRLPGAEAEQRRQLLWGALGFASIALLICAGGVRHSVRSARGPALCFESSRPPSLPGVDTPTELRTRTLEEFDNVLAGIDQMAHELQEKVEKERTFEAQMAHRERLAAVGQFAAGIAHELRTPLATIRLRTQMSQNSQQDGMAATNMRVVLAEIDRLNAMIGKLLHFARPVQRHETLLDLGAVARDRVQRWNEECGAGAARFYEPAEPVIVSGDGEEFRQVFDNLLQNALQASEAQAAPPLAEITLALSGAHAVVHVLDRGPGFDEESLRRSLSPFYTTKERGHRSRAFHRQRDPSRSRRNSLYRKP